MFKRHWEYFVVAGLSALFMAIPVGGAFVSNECAKQAAYNQATSQYQSPVPCRVFIPIGGPSTPSRYPDGYIDDETRNDFDAYAQGWMAWSSYWMFIVTSVGVVVLIFTLRASIRTLNEARNATEAAWATQKSTREIGIAQSRAYLKVRSAELYLGSDSAKNPHIIGTVENTGPTPAKWYRIDTYSTCEELSKNAVQFQPTLVPTPKPKKWSGLGANTETTIPIHTEGMPKQIAKAFFNKATHVFHVFGVLTYETYFGEVFETDFHFAWYYVRDFRDKRIGSAKGLYVTQEVPQKLTIPLGNLRSYEKV